MSFTLSWRQLRRPWAALLAFGCVPLIGSADAPEAITFNEALHRAEARAPMLEARRSQILAARDDAVRAAALPDPKLTFGIDNLPVTGADAFDWNTDDMTMNRVGLEQEFPAQAKRDARQAIADRGVEQAEAWSVVELLGVRQSAARAWIALWAIEREQGSLMALRDQSALATELAEARLAGGTGTLADSLAARAAGLDLESRIDAARTEAATARATLARWLGAESTEAVTAGAPPDLTTLPASAAMLLTSVDRHGALLPWRSREATAEAELALAAAEKRPDWSLASSYGQRGGSRSDLLIVEISMDLPLFATNRQDRGVAARRAELDAVAASHEEARRNQTEAVHRALAEWGGLKRQVALAETQLLPLALDRTRAALAGYAGGGALQPWLDARRDELELRVEHDRHLAELGQAWAWLAYVLPPTETSP